MAATWRRPGRAPPPIWSMTSRSGVPIATSATPWRGVCPVTVHTIVPGEPSVPTDRNQSAPRARMPGTFASVSTLFAQPAAWISSIAARNRSVSAVNVSLTATITVSALSANAAMSAPSSTRYGSERMIARSLNEPGSPSAPFTTTVVGSTGDTLPDTAAHFRPVGKPAPPRPRNPDAATSSMTPSGPRRAAASRPWPPPACSDSARRATGRGGRTRGSKAMRPFCAVRAPLNQPGVDEVERTTIPSSPSSFASTSYDSYAPYDIEDQEYQENEQQGSKTDVHGTSFARPSLPGMPAFETTPRKRHRDERSGARGTLIERSGHGARRHRVPAGRASRRRGEVPDDPLEIRRQVVQVAGRPRRQHLGHDLVGCRPVRLRRAPSLRREPDDARPSVGRIRLPPDVPALDELRYLAADERRLEAGEPAHLGGAHVPRAAQRGEDSERRLGEVDTGSFRSESRPCTAGRHACD